MDKDMYDILKSFDQLLEKEEKKTLTEDIEEARNPQKRRSLEDMIQHVEYHRKDNDLPISRKKELKQDPMSGKFELEEDDEVVNMTPEEVVDLWHQVFPDGAVAIHKSTLGGTLTYSYRFHLAKDKSEVANGIMDNDPLNFAGTIDENGNWQEYRCYLYTKPEPGSYNVYGSDKLCKKNIKKVTPQKLLKRFEEVKGLVVRNYEADNLKNLHFDIEKKLGK